MLAHLSLRSRSVTTEYDSTDAKVAGTSLTMSTEGSIDANDIVVENPLKWLALLVTREKRIFSS